MRSVTTSLAEHTTSHFYSALRTPHSALVSWFPCSFRHRRHERLEILGGECQRLPLLGTHVGGHQDLHDLDAVVERQLRRLAPEEHAHEVPILGLVAVHRSEEHTSELQSHSFISYAVFCLK